MLRVEKTELHLSRVMSTVLERNLIREKALGKFYLPICNGPFNEELFSCSKKSY